jgi:hypothetical protein
MKKLKYILLSLLLIVSCQEQEIPVNDDDIIIIEPPISDEYNEELEFSNKLLYEETFENDEAWKGAWKQFPEEHSFNIVNEPVYRGNYSGKFELRYGDRQITSTGIRSEVLFPSQTNSERWYSYAVFFPSEGWQDDKDDEVVSQWHNGTGTPTLSLRVRNGNLRFRIGHNPNIGTHLWDYYEFGPVPKDKWVEFVYHIIHSDGIDGIVEIWRDGLKIVNHKGPNKYLESKDPQWKIGIYKSTWAKGETDIKLRITYFDNVRIGDENATLKDMSSLDFNTLSSPSVQLRLKL